MANSVLEYIAVQPKVITVDEVDYTVGYLSLTQIVVILRETARIQYNLCDTNEKMIKPSSYMLTQEEYEAWGLDDTYIENLILTREELIRI